MCFTLLLLLLYVFVAIVGLNYHDCSIRFLICIIITIILIVFISLACLRAESRWTTPKRAMSAIGLLFRLLNHWFWCRDKASHWLVWIRCRRYSTCCILMLLQRFTLVKMFVIRLSLGMWLALMMGFMMRKVFYLVRLLALGVTASSLLNNRFLMLLSSAEPALRSIWEVCSLLDWITVWGNSLLTWRYLG